MRAGGHLIDRSPAGGPAAAGGAVKISRTVGDKPGQRLLPAGQRFG